jgi:long-chain fatty acid transport protein
MVRTLRAAVLLLALPLSPAWAGNGLNDIAYGSEPLSMASADIALARDTTAFNTNPAGLTQIKGQMLDILLEPYAYLGHEHTDYIGNQTKPDNWYGSGFGGGYAQRLKDVPVVVGAGLFFQGGAGFVYSDFANPFGPRDEVSGLFGTIKIAPGFGWQVNERWSVGLSTGLLYSTARQKFLPNTSTAAQGSIPAFSGIRIDDLSGFSANIKVGVQYRPAPDWVLAFVYTSPGPIKLENGTIRYNNTASGGGFVTYKDVSLSGLEFTEEYGFGVLHRLNPKWTVAGEVTWLPWARSMDETVLRVGKSVDGTSPLPEPLHTPLNWRNQTLFSLGMIHHWRPTTELKAGVSYARNPVPAETVTPTLALLGDLSLTAGMAHQLSPKWLLALSAGYQWPVTLRHDDPITGPTKERWGALGIYITFSRRW